ncbi:ABC transporter substrate-binding protein [Sphingomonas sp.]|uniref:ABC transporter substrate-binding protein n=1 Tax=Sphingomonas sp. TaxID=28214 RepID=UPI00333EBFFA
MRLVPLLAVVLVGCAAPARMPVSGGIVSTNPCADAILVDLAPERLSAISFYSHDPAATSLPLDVARRFPATAGTAEEVIALRPALVVTSSFTPLATRAAYTRAGLKTLLLDSPASVAASEAQIRMLAAAVGEPGRGEAMVGRIERALAAASVTPTSTLPRRRPGPSSEAPATGPRPSLGKEMVTLLFISGTLANGPGNLLDELITRAGLANAARGYGLPYTSAVALETIAAHPPALILTPGPSRSADLRMKVLARMRAPTRSATFARNLINCGGPTIVPAITRLADLRRGQP